MKLMWKFLVFYYQHEWILEYTRPNGVGCPVALLDYEDLLTCFYDTFFICIELDALLIIYLLMYVYAFTCATTIQSQKSLLTALNVRV